LARHVLLSAAIVVVEVLVKFDPITFDIFPSKKG